MKTTAPMRLRALRFLSDRYTQRERPSYFAELLLFGVIVIAATWPMFSLAHAMAQANWIETLTRVYL
jgi:hypothetical protein